MDGVRRKILTATILAPLIAATWHRAAAADDPPGAAPARKAVSPYAAWQHGPARDASYFPIAVWLQNPKNAGKYKALGINLYVGLYQGPTAEQLAELARHDMPVICEQNDYARKHLDHRTIVGWMHGDEPDNAQSLGRGRGYGPPIPPKKIVADYEAIRAADPSRPVLLNLGQGVAWDGWHGRGVRTNHPEDYPEYVRGGDVVSFDIYPAVHDKPAVAGKLWYVARGVERLRRWSGEQGIVWNCIECTRISNRNVLPTPQQIRTEVWMSIIHGSQGLIYFCHQFQPQFIEAALLADASTAQAVGAVNRRIHALAPILNGPTIENLVSVRCTPADADPERTKLLSTGPVATLVKRRDGVIYVFAVRMGDSPVRAEFRIAGLRRKAVVEVLDEDRQIPVVDGVFADEFPSYATHLYRIRPATTETRATTP